MKHLVTEKAAPILLLAVFLTGCMASQPPASTPTVSAYEAETGSQQEFDISTCSMATTGSNPYFILEPGFQLVLQGGSEELIITVLDEIVEVDGITTRVVEERETRNGELIEISRNFFAICEQTKDIFYFGEDVDIYKEGKVSSHSGAWRSGEGEAKFGLIMPGAPSTGMKYYQEIAPGVAMDRAEIISLDETFSTPAGEFANSLKVKEGTALNPLEVEYKTYAPGIGLVQDQNLLLTEHGFVEDN